MNSRGLYRNELFATLLFFVGLSGIVGWVATTAFLLRGWTNSGHWATWLITFRTIGLFSLWSSFFLVFTAIGLPLGVRLFRECERKKKILVRAMVPTVMLSPVYAVVGVSVILATPFLISSGRAILNGPELVKSVNSPDGNYEAYVVDYPALDGPDQSLVIDRKDGIHFLEIADLPEDIDSIKEIHWSPQSDIVVFQTWRNLYVVTVPSYKTVSIYLGREWRRKSPNRQSTFSSGGVRLEVTDIAFPEPGVVTYRIKGASEAERLEVGSLLK